MKQSSHVTESGMSPDPNAQFQTGADGVLESLRRVNDAVVVVSEGMRNGMSFRTDLLSGSTHVKPTASQGLSFAIGQAMTGVQTAVLMDVTRFDGVREEIQSARERQLPLTIVLSQFGEASGDAIAEFSGLGCPLLYASDAQALMDLGSMASNLAISAMLPVLILSRSDHSLWTYQLLSPAHKLNFRPSSSHLDYFLIEILGSDRSRPAAWLDTANPMASGVEAKGDVLLKRQLGRSIFVEDELADVTDQIMHEYGLYTGRVYSAIDVRGHNEDGRGSGEAEAALIQAGTGPVSNLFVESGFKTISVTRLSPFPVDELVEATGSIRTLGILQTVGRLQSDEGLLTDRVRGILSPVTPPAPSRKWLRSSTPQSGDVHIATVFHSADWHATPEDLLALKSQLTNLQPNVHSVVAGLRMNTHELHLPAVDEVVQRMKRSGISFSSRLSEPDAMHPGGDGHVREAIPTAATMGASNEAVRQGQTDTEILIVSGSSREMWPLMQGVCKVLHSAGAKNIHGGLHPASGATSFPVLGRVTYVDGPSNVPSLLCFSADLLRSQAVRALLPSETQAYTLINQAEALAQWPFWMADRKMTLHTVLRDPGVADAAALMLVFLQHGPSLDKASTLQLSSMPIFSSLGDNLDEVMNAIEEHTSKIEAAAFQTPDSRPPEGVPPADLTDRAHTSLPSANLALFWKTVGHLSRNSRFADAPIDPLLTAGFLPASTGSLILDGESHPHIPGVIPERCTGCGSCWAICPEASVLVRPFTLETIWKEAEARSRTTFVQLPRLAPAVIKSAYQLFKQDVDLHQYLTLKNLFLEAFTRVLDKAGVVDDKRSAIETERDHLLASIGSIRPVRSAHWFDDRDAVAKGAGTLLGLSVDPDTCTSCQLCLSACPEQALEMVETTDVVAEWRQLAALHTLPDERPDVEPLTQPGAVLTGRTSRRVFRAGNEDHSNLNRTALRLFLEALGSQTNPIRTSILTRINELVERIDARLQHTIDQSVRVNDFEEFSKRLKNADFDERGPLGDLLEKNEDALTDRLTLLADTRSMLLEERERLEPSDAKVSHPHVITVDATSDRNLGLAPFPANPFSMPYYRARIEQVADLTEGIKNGLSRQYAALSSQIRMATRILDDVYSPEDSLVPDEEDERWAESVLPHFAIVLDRFSLDILASLRLGSSIHVLTLSGAEPGPAMRSVWTVTDLAPTLGDFHVGSTVLTDPVRMLNEFSDAFSADCASLHQVYASDPVRDGIATRDVLKSASLARKSGLFPCFVKAPGGPVHWDSTDDGAAVTAADCMILQQRFSRYFELLPRRDWSSDQIPLAAWLSVSNEKQMLSVPYVEREGKNGQMNRFKISGELLDFVMSVWASRMKRQPDKKGTKRVEKSAEDVATAQTESPSPETPSVSADALGMLTERLLAMSGFDRIEDSLTDWLAARKEVDNA